MKSVLFHFLIVRFTFYAKVFYAKKLKKVTILTESVLCRAHVTLSSLVRGSGVAYSYAHRVIPAWTWVTLERCYNLFGKENQICLVKPIWHVIAIFHKCIWWWNQRSWYAFSNDGNWNQKFGCMLWYLSPTELVTITKCFCVIFRPTK